MKYILRLSLKYVERQKFRTVLTFTGVMLAAFIMGISMFTANSLAVSMSDFVFNEYGKWEVYLDRAFDYTENDNEALRKLDNNVLAEDVYSFSRAEFDATENIYSDVDDTYIEVSCGDEIIKKALSLNVFRITGDDSICGRYKPLSLKKAELQNGIFLPSDIQNYGYSEGDTVVLSFTPVKEGARGKTVTEEFVIEGFIKMKTQTFYTVSVYRDSALPEHISEDNPGMFFNSESTAAAYFRINDGADFDISVGEILSELTDNKYSYSDLVFDGGLNSMVLMLELKTLVKADGFIVYAALAFAFMFLVWLVTRFIIDNTFEISVAERNRKYNLLKTLGASKGQLSALTAFEALFYCLTAVPAGTLISFFTVKYLFGSFRKAGITQSVFSVHHAVILWVFALCILSVFISSYTSALWPTRKMTLVNAMNYGVSGKRKKKTKIKKNRKLHKSPNGLIWLYTKRNIGRTKGKFIFSAVTGSVSIIMLVVMLMTTDYLKQELARESDSVITDYEYYNLEDLSWSRVSEYFDSENFASVRFVGNDSYIRFESREMISGGDIIDSDTADKIDSTAGIKLADYRFGVLSEEFYDISSAELFMLSSDSGLKFRSFAEMTGTSYEKFRESGESLLVIIGQSGNRYRKLSKPVTVTSEGTEYRISGICWLKNVYRLPGAESGYVLTAAENSDRKYKNCSLYLTFADTEHHDICAEKCREFEKKNNIEISDIWDNYISGTGSIGMFNAFKKTEIVFFVFLWLTGIVSVINLTNTRIINSQREYFILRCSGMTKKQLVKLVLQEVVLFAVVSTTAGIILGVMFFISLWGGISYLDEAVSGGNWTVILAGIIKKTAAPAVTAAVFSMTTNLFIPAAFASPLIKKMFATSSDIVNSNDLR